MPPSKIEWCTDHWEPVGGCRHASEGCRNCYAETLLGNLSGITPSRFRPIPRRYDGLVALKSDRARFTGEIAIWPDKLVQPLSWRKPRTVFVCSQSDLFYEARPFRHIELVHYIYAATGHIKYLELTKRPERRREFLTWYQNCRRTGIDAVKYVNALLPRPLSPAQEDALVCHRGTFDNVARGVSVENQETADERIPALRATPSAMRFVSYEPALGAVDVSRWMICQRCRGEGMVTVIAQDAYGPAAGHKRVCQCMFGGGYPAMRGLDWLIAGCESGPGARPAELDWFRAVRDQCAEAKVPFFLKQAVVLVPCDCENGAVYVPSTLGHKKCPRCLGEGGRPHLRKGCPALDGQVHDARPEWLTGGAQ